jgi:hypothetical protein
MSRIVHRPGHDRNLIPRWEVFRHNQPQESAHKFVGRGLNDRERRLRGQPPLGVLPLACFDNKLQKPGDDLARGDLSAFDVELIKVRAVDRDDFPGGTRVCVQERGCVSRLGKDIERRCRLPRSLTPLMMIC